MTDSTIGGSPAKLALWEGRRGVINTALVGLLALLAAFGLWTFAERTTVIPACRAYANEHGITYVNFKGDNHRRDSGIVCLFTARSGDTSERSLRDIVPYLTDQWVGLAMGLQLTVPVFAILFALARVGIYHGTGGVI